MGRTEEMYFDAGKATWLLGADKNDTTHPTMTYRLDHEINEEQLRLAWIKTMRVYPALNCKLDMQSRHLIFNRADDEPVIIHTQSPVCPCTPLAKGRPVALSWYKDKITLVTYHSVMDGVGIINVIKTLIYEYCRIHFGKDLDSAGFMLKEGRRADEYYRTQNNVDLGKYTPKPLVMQPFEEDVFVDEDMKHPENGSIITGAAKIRSEEFIAACKSCGATPAVMLCMLFGRAAYSMDKAERRRMEFSLTLDQRAMLGLSDSLGQCSSAALLGASYDELMKDEPKETAARLRAELNEQRAEDYVKSYIAISRTYAIFIHNISAVISYEGRLDFGSCGSHVLGMSMVNNTANTLHMVELNGHMILTFQFGMATEKYMSAVLRELEKSGVSAEIISEPAPAKTEIRQLN